MAVHPQTKSKYFLTAMSGVRPDVTPLWFMRQAGRYLPEYRATRTQAGSFLDLCYNPELAAEVTYQPIRRYGLDAAILFADILLIPHALGQKLSFVEGEGPRLDPPVKKEMLDAFRERNIHETLSPVYETLKLLRTGLPPQTALIGFAGAPWTVATYMLAGGPSDDPSQWRGLWRSDRSYVDALIDLLCEATIDYLIHQIDAGAEAVQLFDTWAGGLPEDVLRAVSLEPMDRIASAIKSARPGVPVILFPKGVGPMLPHYARLAACDGLSIDFATPWDYARRELSPHTTVQGGLDPQLLIDGGEAMDTAARALLDAFADVPYVFNLGHGLTPGVPPDNVARLVDVVRSHRA